MNHKKSLPGILLIIFSLTHSSPSYSEDWEIVKSVSLIAQRVSSTFDQKNSATKGKEKLTAYGPKGEMMVKIQEREALAWFAGAGLGVLKGDFDGNVVGAGSYSSDLKLGLNADTFGEGQFLLNPRFALSGRMGLAYNKYDLKKSKPNINFAYNPYEKDGSEGNIELFLGLGASFAFSDTSSVTAFLRFSLLDIKSWSDTRFDNSGKTEVNSYQITGLNFIYSFF